MMFQFIADAFQWKEERQLRAGLLGSLNYILIGGQLVQSAWGWLTDQTFDWQVSPVLSTVDEVQKALFKAKQMVDKGQDPYKDISVDDVADLVEYLAKAGGQLKGLPTPYLVQVERGIRNKLAEGEDIDIKDFLFSQWALEPPKKGAEEKVEDTGLKLGEIKEGQEDKPLTEKELKIYTTIDQFREIGDVYSKVLPQDVLDNPNSSKESKAWAESEIARSKANILPDVSLYKINTEDNGDTIINYYQQWQARSRITNLQKLNEFDKLYPKAYLGNVTRQQYEVLKQYLEAEDKKTFLEAHDGLRVNPRNEWLKDPANARGAALLALRDDAKLLSKEAYTEFNRLIKELDIPDSAIPEMILPPTEEVTMAYFERNETVDEFGANSWEDKLIQARNPELREWLFPKSDPIDTPIASLELKVKNRENFDKLDELDADSDEYKELRSGEFLDDIRRIEVIEKGTDDSPIPTSLIESHVDYGRIQDGEGVGASSAESMLFRVDNIKYDEFRTDETIWGDNALQPIDQTRIPIWRLDVEMSKLEEGSEEYLELKRKRQGYTEEFTRVDDFVSYYGLPVAGFRQERYLQENPEFAAEMKANKGIEPPDYIPPEEYDDLLEKEGKTPEDLLRIGAYDKKVPIDYSNPETVNDPIDDYVSYHSITKPANWVNSEGTALPWYEDDWWMIEHPDFYKEVYLGILGNQKKDYRKVPPTRAIGASYLAYLRIVNNQAGRDLHRLNDTTGLDEWGVSAGIWKTTMTEQRRRQAQTPEERFSEKIQEEMDRIRR